MLGFLLSPSLLFHACRNACRPLLAYMVLLASAPIAAAQIPSTASPALAVFNGQPVLEDQLPSELLSQLRRMEQQIYLVRLRGLQEVIDKQLIADEALRQNMAPQVLVQSRIAAVPEPTGQQVQTYYNEHKAAINQSFEEAAPGIRSMLKNGALQDDARSYTQKLLQDAVNNKQLVILLRPPKVEIEPDPKRLQGDANAPVTIVEFSDFSCPYCSRADSILSDILARYPGRVRVSYRDFPLTSLHPNAELAAEASRCAEEQDHYWPYHDMLFTHVGNQTHDDLIRYARELRLETAKFSECLDSGRYRVSVERDRELGMRGGVMSTPSFFVNGAFVVGLQTAAEFEQTVQRAEAMQKAASQSVPQTR